MEVAAGSGTEMLRAAVVIGADGSNGQMRRLAAGLGEGSEVRSTDLPPEPE